MPLLVACAAGCAALGPVNDGTSLAYGFANGGMLMNGVRLPAKGDGWQIPPTWAKRGNNFGTDELVSLIVRAARRVQAESPGPPLYVADLSPQFGGRSQWHRSHQTGRDADLIFFTLDENGKPRTTVWGMNKLGDDGWNVSKAQAKAQLDVARTWLLVRALLEDPLVDVQYLFISNGLKRLLLDHAAALGEPDDLQKRASAVLHQPGGRALPHDDHLHLRIYCPASDRALGCHDNGPLRWFKKSYKYLQARRLAGPRTAAQAHVARPFCQLLSRGVVAGL